MASTAMPPTTPPAIAPVLDEPPERLVDAELLLGDVAGGIMPYVGEKVLPMSGVALASHWHGDMEKFLRS